MGFGLGSILGGAAAVLNPVQAIATVGGIAGDIYSARSQAQSVADTNAANTTNAREQMEFQERMSDTSVQRMTADMKAAGVNPMLAAGAGESTPSGTMPPIQPIPSVAAGALTGAKDTIRLLQDVKESNSRINLQGYQSWDTAASAGVKDFQKDLIQSQTATAKQNASLMSKQNELLDSELAAIRSNPKVFGYMKALSDRGMDVNSAAKAVSVGMELLP